MCDAKMKTEEVKYVYQEGPLLVPEKNNGAVYQETTIANNRSQQKPLKGNSKKPKSWWSRHLFSRFPLVLSSLALIVCVVVIIVSSRSSPCGEASEIDSCQTGRAIVS